MKNIEAEIQDNEFVKLLLESIGDDIFVLNRQGKIIGTIEAVTDLTELKSARMRMEEADGNRQLQCTF
ncbi:MAG: hypothetical protein QNL62_25975 [Gammaproteobacteria bacterium]|nr:hypothetical protein [Gammaproteobacteria bacterium]